MQTAFTPLASLAGGMLIGSAAVLLMLLHGRIAGASGILTGVFVPASESDRSWRIAIIAGMASAPLAVLMLTGRMPSIDVTVPSAALVVGGLLVGIGVTLGSGCTSGHGVCGIARLSSRSIVATLVFMIATGVTVYLIRHGLGG